MKKSEFCDGEYCLQKEKCQLYVNFIALVKAGKFPRSIDSMHCVEPIWQDVHFTKLGYSEFVEIEKIKEAKD